MEPQATLRPRPPAVIPAGALRLGGGQVARPAAAGLGWRDGQARAVRYLRLSVVDRCNLRCRYCMPAEGVPFVPKADLLSFEELARLTRVFVRFGVRSVRLTGGEPLVRRDLPALVARLAAIPGLEDLALSTNATHLAPLARPLRAAGLHRVNVSLDSLDAATFADITRSDTLPRVLAGLDAAADAGLGPIKLNVVVLRGRNDHELPDLVRFAASRGFVLRFIESMPIGVDDFWSPESHVPIDAMLATLRRDFDVTEPGAAPSDVGLAGGGPARYALCTPRGAPLGTPPVRVGFIAALSQNFCSTCNRVRVTATGVLQECLAFPGQLSLRDLMRSGADDDALADAIGAALATKGPGHGFAEGQFTYQSMSVTGG